MIITTELTASEYAALLTAVERSGFSTLESFVYWAAMQRTNALLAEAEAEE